MERDAQGRGTLTLSFFTRSSSARHFFTTLLLTQLGAPGENKAGEGRLGKWERL